MSFGNQYKISYADLTEDLPRSLLAPIDQDGFVPRNLYEKSWSEDGVLYLPKILPDSLVDAYCEVRSKLDSPGGWRSPTPYVHIKEMRDLALHTPVVEAMEDLLGEPVGLHLCLTGWVTTERDWHQDTFLNPEYVGNRYIAAWFALDDINPDSGPFQFVPGSHRWPVIRRHRVFQYLTSQEQLDEGWPTHTQKWVANACMDEIVKRNQEVVTYTPSKGDVLLWHSNLVHRGSPANKPGMVRKSLIAHYSALSVRKDMLDRRFHDNNKTYFYFPRGLE